MSSSIIEHLTNAKNSLAPENWSKGNYFAERNNTLCMCAHGALQVQVNPKVRNIFLNIEEKKNIKEEAVAARRQSAALAAAAGWSRVSESNNFLFNIWNNRPDWIKNNYVFNNQDYGNLNVHYLLGMVGLTVSFNDLSKTTLEDVKKKFDEAIELAKLLNL